MAGESRRMWARGSNKTERSLLHLSAIHCTGKLVQVARVLWPTKTAAHWAAAAGVKERMAKYWLAGAYEVSDSGRRAIIREIY